MSIDVETPAPSLKDDLLDGVKEFADFLGWDEQVTYRMLRQGHIPGQQMGRKWVGTKSAVRARFQSAA